MKFDSNGVRRETILRVLILPAFDKQNPCGNMGYCAQGKTAFWADKLCKFAVFLVKIVRVATAIPFLVWALSHN